MLQLIELFLNQGWTVTFGTTAKKNTNSIDLSRIGVEEVLLQLNDSSFDKLVKELSPTIVLFDRFMTEEQFGWRVADNCPGALRILDTEDLHSLRKTRQEAFKKGIAFSNELLLSSEITKREVAAMYRCDISLIISTYEMQLLHEVFRMDRFLLYHIPFMYPEIDQERQNSWKTFEERKHFVSIGNFLHAPNVDATVQLKKNIWRKIKTRLPEAELHIYGAYPTQQILEYHNEKEGFHVHGFVKDAHEVIGNSRVLVAPLRFGAGIKGKLTDAMFNGTPSVTTTIGAEGMDGGHSWSGFVENDEDQFVERCIQLYFEETTWKKAQKNGVHIINSIYNEQVLGEAFIRQIVSIQNDLEAHRQHNFVGIMLQHHTMQGTKYMSRWIEEKQRHQSSEGS